MLNKKRTKASRHRGSSSHGWGHKKKHRGSGHRGGFGLSGTGARGDAQKSGLIAGSKGILLKIAAQKGVKLKTLMKNYSHFGKRGFKSIYKKQTKTLSLKYIEDNFDKLVDKGIIAKDKNEYIFDVSVLGYEKVLGNCKFTKKLTVVADEISNSAKQRILDAGGKVEVKFSSEEDEWEDEETSEKQ